MKCQKCGNNEANYHYRSNINGRVTESHLCSECAAHADTDSFSDTDRFFEEMFDGFFGRSRRRSIWDGFGMMPALMPTMLLPRFEIVVDDGSARRAENAEVKTEVDEKMKLRREINLLRREMQQAARSEDFEKAAQIRDRIRDLEAGKTEEKPEEKD